MSERIKACLERTEDEIEELQGKLDYLSTKKNKLEEELEHIVDSVQEVLRQKKEELIEKLNDIYTLEKQKILIDVRDKQQLAAETMEGLSRIRELRGSQSDEEAKDLERLLEQKNKPAVAYDDEKPRLVDINLNFNFSDLLNAAGRLPFGDVDAFYDDGGVSVMTRFLSEPSSSVGSADYDEEPFTGRAVHVSTIHTRVESDNTDPKLNDIVVVEVDDIVATVVTDRSNKCVKSFYTRGDMHFYSIETASTQPKGISRVGIGKVGVTFPEAKSIKFLKVTPALKRDKEIKTGKRYRGIAMLDLETLVVSTYYMFPGSVDFIDFAGNVLRSITTDQTGECMFAYPFYLCTNLQRQIIVSDCEKKTITCLSETGRVVFQYGGGGEVTVAYPLGVALNTFGDILVVDCDNHKIVKILAEGQGAKVVLGKEDGITGPYSVDVDQYGVFYVAQWNGDVKKFSLDGDG